MLRPRRAHQALCAVALLLSTPPPVEKLYFLYIILQLPASVLTVSSVAE